MNTPTPNPRCLSIHRRFRSIHYLFRNDDAGDMIPKFQNLLILSLPPDLGMSLVRLETRIHPLYVVCTYNTLGFWPRVVVEDPAWQKTCHFKPETSLRNNSRHLSQPVPSMVLEEPSSHESQRDFHELLIGCLFPVLNSLRHVCVWTLYSASPVHFALICLEIPPANLIGGAAPRKFKPWTMHVAVAFLQCSSPSFLHSTPLSSGGELEVW